ncbi:ribosome biogenesis protein Nop53/GLTSCR2 [Butyriboletus roseoflavus]|nr:ribosome biogenesis protein Nop53/GLTSCR2 [Butyriboletus roseoflavus]
MSLIEPASSSNSSWVIAKPVERSTLGAPSQLSQSSRKGKRAWRKNIDIQHVEEGLENLRAEERVVGTILQKQTDDQLFVVDTKGDEQVRKSLPRYSKLQLTSTKILSQRSAVPAVVSRATKPFGPKISRADKERLDPTEFGAGSAAIDVSYAVKHSGRHNLWDVPAVEEIVPDGLETVQKPVIKKPDLGHPRDVIDVPAVSIPHPGASYNPPVQAHEALLIEAYKIEQRRQEEVDRLREAQNKIEQARVFASN